MGLMPPGSAKSTYSSIVFPTHFLGRNKNTSVIVASYGSDLPKKFGRKARAVVRQPIFKRVFDCEISPESQAADEWGLTNGSEWMGAGILSGITGNRADGVVWDDLMKGREAADSKIQRDKVWDGYIDDLMTRKKPHAWEVGINCMVGGTLVAMADGSEKCLRDIIPGDRILSYLDGGIVSSKVLNWANKGPDNVFTIKTSSGRTVTANVRHPFLIEIGGKVEWVRLKNIRVGHRVLRVIGENGGVFSAKSAVNQLEPVGSVTSIMVSGVGRKELGDPPIIQKHIETDIYVTVTELISTITKLWSRLKMGFVRSVKNLLELMTPGVGVENFVLTTATQLGRFEDYFATTVTTLSENGPQKKSCLLPLNTFEIIPDIIVAIEPAGYEDVFDIQVEYTENFIANGLLSHNTRWHEDDPAGRILPVNYSGESGWIKCQDGNDWYVVCLPAICEREDDLLGRQIGGILWPEWFTQDMFVSAKRNNRTWSALYQQRPAPESGDFFEAEWLKPYGEGTRIPLPPRDTLHIYGASDYATTDSGGNYTVHIVAGVDQESNVYILDLWRKRSSSVDWVETFCDLVQKWKPMGWAEENGQIRAGVGPFLNKRLMERHLYIVRAQFPTRGDKQIRAQSIRGRMGSGKVYFPHKAAWFPDLKKELLTFPMGKTDDMVDALGLLGQVLDKMVSGSGKDPEEMKPKVLSTDPELCTVTMNDVWECEEQKNGNKGKSVRIR